MGHTLLARQYRLRIGWCISGMQVALATCGIKGILSQDSRLDVFEDFDLVTTSNSLTPSPAPRSQRSSIERFVRDVVHVLSAEERSKLSTLFCTNETPKNLHLITLCSGSDGVVPTLEAGCDR